MPTVVTFSPGEKAKIAEGIRPMYIVGAEVTILGRRRGRYDVRFPEDTRFKRFSGCKTRCDSDRACGQGL